jgi:hypothetical protein
VSSCSPPPHPPSRPWRNPDALYQDVLLQTWVWLARKYWIVREAATSNSLRSFSSSSYLEAIHERERAHIAASEREAMKETGSKELELTSLGNGTNALGAYLQRGGTRFATEDHQGGKGNLV